MPAAVHAGLKKETTGFLTLLHMKPVGDQSVSWLAYDENARRRKVSGIS